MKDSAKHKHLLLRYSDKFGPTIELHNQVVDEKGFVWFGKMGTKLGARWNEVFHQHLLNNQSTIWLYLVKRIGTHYEFHRAKLLEISQKEPDDGIPSYYRDHALLSQMSCFFRCERIRRCSKLEVRNIRLASSGAPATETLAGSMA